MMIDGQRYPATLPTEADVRVWEVETCAAAALRCGATPVAVARYATVAQVCQGRRGRVLVAWMGS